MSIKTAGSCRRKVFLGFIPPRNRKSKSAPKHQGAKARVPPSTKTPENKRNAFLFCRWMRWCFGALVLLCSIVWASPKPGDFFASGPRDRKRIALTFDDGPGPTTKEFLDLLDRYGAKATFFVMGKEVRKHPGVLKEIVTRGHEVGNHLWNHINYKKREKDVDSIDLVKAELAADMDQTRREIEKAASVPLKIARMPYGIDRPWIKAVAKEKGYVLVNWSWGEDWLSKPFDEIEDGYLKAIRPGAILLYHDGGGHRRKSLALAEAVLKKARADGYEIVPVGVLIGM